MKKLKVKKKAKIGFTVIIAIIIFLSIGIYSGIKIYKQKEYEKTTEYQLISLGYSEEETAYLLNTYEDSEITYILEQDKNDIYFNIANETYFIYDYFYDYIEYYNENDDKDLTGIVEIINTNTNYEYYTNTTETDTSKGYLMLVNKYNYLSEDYTPEDLVSISTTYAYGDYGSQQVTSDTYEAFLNLWEASHAEGFYLMVSSSYRGYEKQEAVYNEYANSRGTDYADSIAARAGYSEHQTGYTLDIFEKGTTQSDFENTESYAWLIENAHKYGFILRYPQDKEDVTGYSFESWHYRYVGVEAATYIYENNITFDEYYAYFVK